MNKINTETLFGGIFSIISVIAAIIEMALNNYETVYIAGAIKDISATMLAVMLLFLVFKNFYVKKIVDFEGRLKSRLEKWAKDNRNIIRKSKIDKAGFYGFDMFTDMNNFYKGSEFSKNSGWFVRFPEIKEENYNHKDIKIDFHLNKGTFFEGMGLNDEELEPRYEKIANNIIDYIRMIYSAEISKIFYKNHTITITMSNPIQTDEEIDSLIRILDSMIKAYLVSANIKL